MINKTFEPIKILQDLANTNSSGHLQIRSNSVRWEIYLLQGKLQLAYYSLQSLKTIKYILLRYNFKETAKKIVKQAESILEANQSVFSIINQLVKYNLINSTQKQILSKELTQDAMEFFLWLTEAEYQWKTDNYFTSITNVKYNSNLLDISALIISLKIRLKIWQKLNPLIQSPHQRPVCLNLSLLNREVPLGNISPAILERIFKSMRGITIREIALVLKQNELRVAQLLLPYIKHNVITLQLPKSPLDKLPFFPSSVLEPLISNIKVRLKSTTTITKVPSTQKIYNIVSIDDSPTMLDTIKNYLGTEKYQVSTLENPMISLGLLFDIKPDLILMDFSMPGINGNKLCRILKKSPIFKNTPIIMVSGNLKMLDEDKVQSSGINDCLAKPFTKEDLLIIVEKYLSI